VAHDWYKISQPSDKFSAAQWDAIGGEFMALTLGRRTPDVVLFCNDDHSTTYDYYFSPAAAAIAQELIARYAGTRCESPIGVVDVSPVISTLGWESVFVRGPSI
jgi:hypothetical protein